MKVEIIFEVILFIVLALIQVLFLNQINLFGYATPLLYIYFLIKIPVNTNSNWVILSSFLLGLVIDIFLNTPGMNAAALTITAVVRNLIVNKTFSKEEYEVYIPSIYRETVKFLRYAIILILVHHTTLYLIDSFSLFNFTETLIRIGSSFLFTFILIISIDSLLLNKSKSGTL